MHANAVEMTNVAIAYKCYSQVKTERDNFQQKLSLIVLCCTILLHECKST